MSMFPHVRIRDAMRANGKQSMRSEWFSPVLSILLCIVSPVLLLLLVPAVILSQIVNVLFRLAFPNKSKPVTFLDSKAKMDSPRWDKREFDLVLFGATGFTGRLAADYLVRQHPKLKWSLAGRNRAALEKLREELRCSKLVQVVIADANDSAALEDLARRAKCVISTAGPFFAYSSELLRQCVQNGTHYCDITGEVDWVQCMIEQHDSVAKQTGAVIVPLCGHDSLPWDLIVYKLNQRMKKAGESLSAVECFDDIIAAPSGGTLLTILSVMDSIVSPRWYHKRELQFDPLLKTLDGKQTVHGFSMQRQLFMAWSGKVKSWIAPFFMAEVNGNVVKRSNALLGYSSSGKILTYSEAQVFPDVFAAFNASVGLVLGLLVLAFYPLRFLLIHSNLLPAPGCGPDLKQLQRGFLRITAVGRGGNGSQKSSELFFPNDAGYIDTARMLVESGLSVVSKASSSRPLTGGFYTPAAAMGDDVLDRLIAGGCVFVEHE